LTAARVIDLASLSAATCDDFVAALGGVFEHTPWIAERAYAARPFASVDALHRAMVAALAAAAPEAKLALIRAHPELAGKEAAAGTLAVDSRGEQSSAGLDRCTADELARLRAGNRAYREKFGFPFVMAVKHRDRRENSTHSKRDLSGRATPNSSAASRKSRRLRGSGWSRCSAKAEISRFAS
jgi:2-oxo-4-hydroxy-4-carboxy-5-ureidoimidazoline decarboxylase